MRTLRLLLEKEFRQIFRDKGLLPVIFILPLIQLLIMPLAANFDVKNINLAVVDRDHSTYTQQLVSKIASSGYFHITGYHNDYTPALRQIEREKADIIMEVPAHFEQDLVKENKAFIYLAADAINGTKAGLGSAYLTSILADYNNEVRLKWLPAQPAAAGTVDLRFSNWFNPYMNYRLFMVPGILVLLVTMVCGFIAALNIVKEKEIGTIEQINVTPVKKWQFIMGKMIPFWVIGMVDFTLGLLLARLVYGIIPVGNLALLYMFLAVYLVALLGFGLLISTYSDNQLQAMFVAFFFIMIFMLMSGLFVSVDNMPGWAKVIAMLTPVTHFVEVVRMIVLKGSKFSDIQFQLLVEVMFAVVLNGWAILNYRKTS
ncbi:ABC transporter permease [Chitinophaga tropicalis]|uniref:ABC transporter permease n=1 Tax=Chitinophaga tropicalis TaxID=2683588 RepID=A0A7K1U1J3_9BACT|nr:ABC transporter permease [Chitinophaga tropicalis]MVT08244.1 ABC transporter permease [Chitinophaga tropicalis]